MNRLDAFTLLQAFGQHPRKQPGPVREALAEEKAWVLHERTLPVPAAASDALRASIAAVGQPDLAASQGMIVQTNEEWVKRQAATGEGAVAVWKSLLEKRDAKSMALGGTSPGDEY